MEFTHSALCDIARRWLLRPSGKEAPGCDIAFNEVGGILKGEVADAWGYRLPHQTTPGSVMVEVKVSRADFLADKAKPHRSGDVLGLGNYRYYLCPEGLIQPEELPEKWGLLWVNKRGHTKTLCGHAVSLKSYATRSAAQDWWHPANTTLEMGIMAHLLKRIGDPEAVFREVKYAKAIEIRYLKLQEEMRELRRKNILLQIQAEPSPLQSGLGDDAATSEDGHND